MKRGALATASAAVLCCASLALAQQPSAQPAGSAAPPATAAPNAKPAPPPAPEARPTPPPGHGQMGQEQITDRVVPDKSLAPGTVAVMIIDGNHRPVPNTDIELAILFSSVTKGESKESVKARTDEKGQYTFTGLKFGSGISYRVKTTNGPATYSSQPFGLNDQGGMRVLQHRYEAVSNIAESRLLLEVHMILDVKQDNIAINHLLVAVNLGREAYVASGLSIPLPKGYEAFSAQESTDGITIKDKDGMMVLDGTFPPGQRQLTYRYQMPLEGGDELGLKLPMPPRVAASRVVLKANEQMTLEVGRVSPRRAWPLERWRQSPRGALEGPQHHRRDPSRVRSQHPDHGGHQDQGHPDARPQAHHRRAPRPPRRGFRRLPRVPTARAEGPRRRRARRSGASQDHTPR